MTTIRRRRVPAPPAMLSESRTARTAGAQSGHAGEADQIRLALIDAPAPRTTLDGAWWPRTRSLSVELPGLVRELHRRGIRVTRVAFHPDAWMSAPRRLAADGRTIRLGWFRSIDPQLLNLTGDARRSRLDLLVVPPDATAAVARQASTAACDRANRRTPTALLAAANAAGAPVPRPRAAVDGMGTADVAAEGAEAMTVWHSEEGHLDS